MCETTEAVSEDALGCCAAIIKASRKGALAGVDKWVCPRCGMLWTPRMVEGVRYWEAHPIIQVFRRR